MEKKGVSRSSSDLPGKSETMATEHDLQTLIIEYLVNLGYLVIRCNSGRRGNVSFYRWHDGQSSYTDGISDIIAIKGGKTWFIEVKQAGKLSTLSDGQRAFLCSALAHGAQVAVVDDLQDLVDALRAEERTRPI